ncbi:DMT family transporter [Nocardioides piscis]|uniref:DMT family transporter n=1 Tax=Nocardioides piscis TaxID=2714938 RepID=A0A6G7YF69_9ACTN|nr:DMT family transporter [Nocardioides piscis]QIK75288.1 DMT family transporter [Nocardioides piscis]
MTSSASSPTQPPTLTLDDDEPQGPPTWLPLTAVATTLVLWASAFVGIRHLGESVPPGALSLSRLLIMALALLVLMKGRLPRLPSRREWPLVLVGGASWFGLYNLALNESERRIDAGTAALIIQIGPILTALFATFFLGERLTKWLLVGMAVGFTGVVIIGRASSQGENGDLVGVLLSVVAAVTFAVGVLTQKKLLSGMKVLDMTFWYAVVGAAVCLPWAGQTVSVLSDASADTWWWIVYLGIFPSAIAFSTWTYALSHADAGKFAQSTFLVPFITSLMAWLLLDEVPPAMAFLGGGLCIAGVLVARRRARP